MLITKKDLENELGLKVSTINKYMKEGMPFYKIGPAKKLVRFSLDEVKNWLMGRH